MQALFLPVEDRTPLFICVPIKRMEDADGSSFIPDLNKFLGDPRGRGICSDHLPGEPFAHLSHALHLNFRDAFLTDGSPRNGCISDLLGQYAYWWRGPVVVMKSNRRCGPNAGADPEYAEIHREDLRDIVAFLRAYDRRYDA